MLEQLRSMGSKMVSIQCAGHGQSEQGSIEILQFHENCLFLALQARQGSHGSQVTFWTIYQTVPGTKEVA